MKRNLYYFAWRELLRSTNLKKNVAAKGVLIFLAIYFSLVALFLGFNLNEYLINHYPDQSRISAFNSLIFIYAGFELVIRVIIQSLPTFGFQSFLILPVKRKRIAKYMLNKSLLHFFNILPLFIILPFTFSVAINELSTISLVCWLTSVYLMVFVNHFLAIYIKWRTHESNIFFYGFLGVAACVFAFNYFGIFDLTSVFGSFFDLITINPAWSITLPVAIIAFYVLNHHYLLNRFYLDEISQKKKKNKAYDFSWLNQIGEYGKMLSLEVKMIARNKRPRTTATMSILFLLYGLLIYRDYQEDTPELILVLGGMFMTGVFSMTYGQFFPAWHSKYYPFLMAQNVKMKQILQSAFFLMAVTNVVYYLLSLGYMFITPKVLYIHFIVMLYNIGVNSFIIFALGLTNRKAIDLGGGAFFNYQGMGASQWLISFPILIGPLIVYGIFSLILGNTGAYIVLGSLGFLGIILHPRLIDYFTKEYLKRKHLMIQAYKE